MKQLRPAHFVFERRVLLVDFSFFIFIFFVTEKLWMNSQESPWRPTESHHQDDSKAALQSRLRISPSKFYHCQFQIMLQT